MCDNVNTSALQSTRKADTVVVRPDLRAKLERLRRGLVADTVRVNPRPYPSLRSSRLNYGLKSGRFGAFDPLRKRSKLFRKGVARFAPPYYFWHKEYINSLKLKPLLEADEPKTEVKSEEEPTGLISCIWCDQSVKGDDYSQHKVKRCKKRYEFLGDGYFQCFSCKEGFLDEEEAKSHVSLHFPNQQLTTGKGVVPKGQAPTKNLSIICRDQAKRKKWL